MANIISEKKIYNLQQNWCYYLIINIIFLIPVCLFAKFPDLANLPFSLDAGILSVVIYLLFTIISAFMLIAVPYGIVLMPWVHFAVELGFVIYAIYKMNKKKNTKLFLITILLTVLSLVLNLYWALSWNQFMGV